MRDWTTWMLQRRLQTEGGDDGGGGTPPAKTFSQADLDAAVAASTATLQTDLKKLADKAAKDEQARLEKDGKISEAYEALKGEHETLKGEHGRLTEVEKAFLADRKARWDGIATELAKTDKGKAALKDVFQPGKTAEEVAGNLALFSRLEASGMIGEMKTRTSPGADDKGGGGHDDSTKTPQQSVADGYRAQTTGKA
jgi:hypothetical protein